MQKARHLIYAVLGMLILSAGMITTPLNAQSQQQRNVAAKNQQRASDDKRGTDAQPFSVKIIPTPKPPEEAERENIDRAAKYDSDWWTRFFGIAAIVIGGLQAVIFGAQLIVFGLQAKRLKETVQKMDDTAIKQLRA